MKGIGKANRPRRVVVISVGAITSQGPTADAFWQGVKACQVAIRPVQHMLMDGFRTRIGGEVVDDPGEGLPYPHLDGFRDRAFDFALTAAREAFDASMIGFGQVPPERWGVVIGTCNAGLLSGEQWYKERLCGGAPNPDLALLVPPQALAEAIVGAFGFHGPALSINTACAAGANAIGYAAELVRYGQADAVLAGGADAFSDVLFAGFSSLESLSPEPAAPYSKDRQGLSLGEGSGMLVLVSEEIARQAGAPVLAEIVGYGLSADGYHPTAPHPEGKGAARAIQAAMTAAGVAPADIQYVNSHGTGTPKNDPAETAATKLGLGEAARTVAVSSTKSMIGHLLGAAGAVEGIVTVKAIEEQVAPPTANFREVDPECDLDYVPNGARPMTIDYAISNNFAFGGANACVVLARAGARDASPPEPGYDRVVITGRATLTSAGNDPATLLARYVSGETVTRAERGVHLGRVEYDPAPFLSRRDTRRMDRLGIFAVCATRLALDDAGLRISDENRERIGVIFGTGVGPMESMENFSRPLFDEGPGAANPAIFPNTVYNAAGGQVAIHVGAIGPASTVTAGHGAGSSAICYGYDLVARDRASAIVCLAADTLTDTVIDAYRELGVLKCEAGTDSHGFALAEAGVALVLERLSDAQARGAPIYGEVLGYGITSDAKGVGVIDARGRGLARAIEIALAGADVAPSDVRAVWGNATGLRVADRVETVALKRVFSTPPVTHAPKLLFGEPMGAGGALNTALALQSWLDQPDTAGPALVTSMSLGGTNFAIILAPFTA